MKTIIMTITPETWISIGLTLFSIAAGSLVTAYFAHRYYARAAKDMEAESKKLRNLHRISLQAMEDAGMVKLNRDAAGEIIGMVHELSAHAVITSHATAELSIHKEVEEH
jgi:hypothetical protein